MSGRLRFATRTYVKAALARLGLEVRRSTARTHVSLGDMRSFLEHLARRGLEPTSVLDVGANRGDWARMAKSVFTSATVVMVEPQVEMRRYLDAFCSEHPGSRWVMAGAGPEPGQMALTVWDDLAGSSFFAPEEGGTGAKQREVPVITLDSLVEGGDLDPPQLVKLDVQGFELETLKGARRLFATTEVFILETSLFEFLPGQPLLHDVVAFMGDRGYVTYDVAGFARRRLDGALAQLDVCFTKKDGFLRRSNEW